MFNFTSFQDWLNEFNIGQEDPETSSANVKDDIKLKTFHGNKNLAQSDFQNDGYEAMDEDSEDEFVVIDVEVTALGL